MQILKINSHSPKLKNQDAKPALAWTFFIMKMLLGLLFIVSALSKLFDMDTFEVYVFSYGILSLNFSFIAARLVVVAELLLAIGLLSNIWNRFVNCCTMLMLIGFTLFLGYAALIGRTDSCQCMGPLLSINPIQSILKNALLILWMLPVMKVEPWQWQPRWYLWVLALVAPFAFVFIISAPDNWMFPRGQEAYNAEELEMLIGDKGAMAEQELTHGSHVVAFLTPGCPYCKLADQKLTAIFDRNGLDSAALTYIVPAGDTIAADISIDSSSFGRMAYRVPRIPFVKITYGERPKILIMKQGEVVGSFHYRNIEEKLILEAF